MSNCPRIWTLRAPATPSAAGPLLAAENRRPVSTPVIDIAIRRALADEPGVYRSVADHPSTVVALRELHRELRVAATDAHERLAEASTAALTIVLLGVLPALLLGRRER